MSAVHDKNAADLVHVVWAQVRLSRTEMDPNLLPDRIEVHPSVRSTLVNSTYVSDHGLMKYGERETIMGVPLLVDNGAPPNTWRLVAPDNATLRYGVINLG